VLLSSKYAEFPGTITWVGFNTENKGMYKFGTAESGGLLSDTIHTFPITHVKACSTFAGGALVLQFNAEGAQYEGSLLQFHASTNPADMTNPAFCPQQQQVKKRRLPE
jgi:hypothetical protein